MFSDCSTDSSVSQTSLAETSIKTPSPHCQATTCPKKPHQRACVGAIARYREFFPESQGVEIVTLNEGNTPLIPAPWLSQKLSKLSGSTFEVWLKYEGLNPTGSFKDRGMTYAVTMAKHQGAKAIVCASTGNTSASAAAHASRANLETIILIPEGKIALGKLSQAMLYGSLIVQIQGNFDEALTIVRQLGETSPDIAVVNSVNPYRLEGQRTGAFEICDQLGGTAPDILAIPVGNAGNISAYWQGFQDYRAAGRSTGLPKMFGFQAEGAAPLVLGHPVTHPETVATAIRIGNPASWDKAMAAKTNSQGLIDSVTDEEILEAYFLLARKEGIFCEPASAAGVAGLLKQARAGKLPQGETLSTVCILTGNGLKDPDNAIAVGKEQVDITTIPATYQALASYLESKV
ncbi:MAG: threonine synthase [Vampirovibrionales bacterium]